MERKKEQAGRGFVATSSVTINAPVSRAWDALVNPDMVRHYMLGANVVSTWREGDPIVWKGELNGKKYEDKGTILKAHANRVLQYSHFSPLSGEPDEPENYHIVTIKLSPEGSRTVLSLSQDNNPTLRARQESEKMWGMMLGSLKELLETSTAYR